MPEVVVAGAGPAGRALAAACARAGLHTVLLAPHPWAPWRATYGIWLDELPGLPRDVVAAAPRHTIAFGTSPHVLDRRYAVLDNEKLRDWLTDPGVEVVDGRLGEVTAPVVVNATGGRGRGTEQTAYGLVVAGAGALVPPDTAVFMDWSRPSREPSFLYGVPVRDGVLVEETCLARKPGLPPDVLAARLRHRLVRAGVPVEGREELVRIPLDVPRPGALAFGAAAGLVHPATGYSLATALRLAPTVAAALAEGLRTSPAHAVRAARHELWPPSAQAVHSMRRFGLRALRRMPGELVPEFFELFFRLPPRLQYAFVSGRTDVEGTAAAMLELFRAAPWRLRRVLAS
ncbi:lycopene cyclase family protein [Amycolatopsis sp.]|uniref:lycopene cyclase family protein n=1 Tax=Amycolatopsis sp. TaxID=37632 RepID=UPI002CF589C0|nr:lycopene cyclase family protein [Amycolatopsis sp.]HVV09592.1 lycopene cyclase family protein [Amycolatopsis sp.]